MTMVFDEEEFLDALEQDVYHKLVLVEGDS